jgi:2-phosphosulfolactate phosphatase
MKIDVVFTPKLLSDSDCKGSLCSVIDVLRATTTIVVALANGATAIYPCCDATEARKRAESTSSKDILLGGEEKGLRIPGFQLGNSPLEYQSSNSIAGKIIFFATTNGTPTMQKTHSCSGAPVYIASLANLPAISSTLVKAAINGSPTGIMLVCSGRYGTPSAEDLYCAGLLTGNIVDKLLHAGISSELGDGALIATGFAGGDEQRALKVLSESEHGRYLQSIGFNADLEFASRIGRYDIVPVFDGDRIALL